MNGVANTLGGVSISPALALDEKSHEVFNRRDLHLEPIHHVLDVR